MKIAEWFKRIFRNKSVRISAGVGGSAEVIIILPPGRILEIKDSDSIGTLSVKTFGGGGGGGGCCILPPISVSEIIKSGQKNKIHTKTDVEVNTKPFSDGKGLDWKGKIFITK